MRFWTETERSADEPLIETENDHKRELLARRRKHHKTSQFRA
jgi:hypothetical protein